MRLFVKILCFLVLVSMIPIAASMPAAARTYPQVTSLSRHHGVYWGGNVVTVRGRNLTHVKRVLFGVKRGYAVHVLSSTRLTVRDPEHRYGRVHVRVVTSAGTSARTAASEFTFGRPTMNSHIQGGLTARQEQWISARVRADHHGVRAAHRSSRWTPAMGVTAMMRARSWLGLPYSWAGGNGSGPTRGVCAHNGGDLDCHIVGFDCSGLALYAWYPYKHLVHYASTQHSRAGRFHPAVGQLMPGDLVFFSGYIADGIGHVAVYEGRGMVIQAEQSGTRVMRSRLVDVIAHSGRYRGATRPTSTGRQGSGPRVSKVTSQVAVRGGYVTITGTGLAGVTSVSVGATRLYSFATRTSTRVVVKVPAHRAGKVSVTVSNAWGTSQRSTTYVGAPYQSSLTPARGPVTGATSVAITGTNLSTVNRVLVGRSSARFRVLASNRLTVTMPAHVAGIVRITLYSRFGTSNQRGYTYVALAPTRAPSTSSSASSSAPTAPPSTSSAPTSDSPPTEASTAPSDGPTTSDPAPSQSSSEPVTPAPTTPADPVSSGSAARTGGGPTDPAPPSGG